MKINTTLGLLAGKLSGSILEKMGRGSTLPGKVALKFDKDILSQLAKNYEIVVITGTNGKTLTTALTVGILQEAFGPILTNPSGANMISGITTTFLRAKHSKANRPIAVLEIDEASLSRICDYIKPSLFVVTNIFRDQMDRYARGVWAGTLRYHNGRFYLFFGTPDEGYFMTSSSKPEGPWEPLTPLFALFLAS